jgi:hypothetical protein
VVSAVNPLKVALKPNGAASVCGAVSMFRLPWSVPHRKEALTVDAVPIAVTWPFKMAELDVIPMAPAVDTEGGVGNVVKLTSFP